MKLRPVHDNILIKRKQSESMTKGGLHVPSTAQDKPQEGEVVEVGEGQPLDNGGFRPPPVKKGDHILFRKYSEIETKVGDDTFVIIRTDALIGIMEPDEKKAEEPETDTRTAIKMDEVLNRAGL